MLALVLRQGTLPIMDKETEEYHARCPGSVGVAQNAASLGWGQGG